MNVHRFTVKKQGGIKMGIFDRKPNIEKMKAKKDVKGLLKALQYKEASVRAEAAKSLAEIGDERAVEPLIHALKDEDWMVVGEAASALAAIGDTRAVEPLIQALKTEELMVRGVAALALGYIEDKRAVEPLILALKDEDWRVREEAASALKNIGEPAIESLTKAMEDKDKDVRETAKETLGKIKAKKSTKNKPKKKSTVRRKQKRCAKCGEPLSESIDYNSTSSGTAILGGGQFWEMMSEKFSLAIYCKKCDAYYCAGCALEAWQKGGEERFICP